MDNGIHASTDTWPRRMRRAQAAEYLRDAHGLPVTEKTLSNRCASGLGPRPEYFGSIPFYRREVLDAWAQAAFTPESPVTVLRRRMRGRSAAVAAEPLDAAGEGREVA